MPPSSQTAYASLQAFKPQSATDVMTTANNQYDIPGYTSRLSSLRGLVNNLSSSVESVDPSVRGRTSGSFVTEGQNQALVNKERAPILSDLSKEQTALGTEQTGFNTASGLAGNLASTLLSQDQNSYQRLLDQYNASTAAEKEAESKRQFDATLAEQKRQADQTAKASSGGGYDLGSIISALNPSAATPAAPKDLAYQSVQKFLTQGKQAAESDYIATLKSANKGNAIDKLKVQLYNQNGIGNGIPSFLNQPGLSTGNDSGLVWSNGSGLANSPTF